MSTPMYDIDEGLYQEYVAECAAEKLHPSISDFLVWLDENDYDRPEVYDAN